MLYMNTGFQSLSTQDKHMLAIQQIRSSSFWVFLLLLPIFFLPGQLAAQAEIIWEQNFGGSENDFAEQLLPASDGGYIIAGASASSDQDVASNNGGDDMWIIKIDTDGNLVWEQNYGGSSNDYAWSAAPVNDGGYVMAGFTLSSDLDVGGNNGINDYWIVKVDSDGDLIWEQNYGGSSLETAYSITQTTDDGYIVAGFSRSSNIDVSANNGERDFWIIKLDTNGDLTWEQNYGGAGIDIAYDIAQTSDGGYIVAGTSQSSDQDVSSNNGGDDYWIVKLDANGDLVWEENFGGTGTDFPSDILPTSDGGYIALGQSNSSDLDVGANNGGDDCWIIKLDADGNLEWERNYGGSGDDYGDELLETDDGYIVAVESTSSDQDVMENNGESDYWIIKLDFNGDLVWEQNFGGSGIDLVESLVPADDEGYVVAGISQSSDQDVGANFGGNDFWVIKVNPTVVLPAINTYFADSLSIDEEGFTNYFEQAEGSTIDTLLLSINSYGQDIGDLEDGIFQVRIDRDTQVQDITTLIETFAPELGPIDAATALKYFWQVTPNYGAPLDTTLGLKFYFTDEDVAKLSEATGTDLVATDLFFFKASSASDVNPCEDFSQVQDLEFKVYRNGSTASLQEWQAGNIGTTTGVVGTMDITNFSCGGLFAILSTPDNTEEALALSHLRLAPNPASETVQLQFQAQETDELQLQVLNLLGQPVLLQSIRVWPGEHRTSLAIGELAPGYYLLTLQNEEGAKVTKPFIKQ